MVFDLPGRDLGRPLKTERKGWYAPLPESGGGGDQSTVQYVNSRDMANSFFLAALLLAVPAFGGAITNSQELARYQHIAQFRNYPDELTRGALSPQEQTHILSDVQQHRFLVNQAQRQQNYQQLRPQPQSHDFHGVQQAQQQQQRQQQEHQQQQHHQQQHQQLQQQQQQQPVYQQNFQPYQQPQDYSFQQPPPSISPSYQTNVHYPTERKPILLQPSYPTEESNTPAPPQQQVAQNQDQQSIRISVPQQSSYRQPSYRPKQPSFDSYQQQFENYVVPDKPKDYNNINIDFNRNTGYTAEPQKEDTPSWVIETQPPTPYRKQKPYDAITFSTESYKVTTAPTKALKYRPKLTTKQEPTAPPSINKDDSSSQLFIKHDRKKLYDQLVSSQTTPRPKVTSPAPTAARSTTQSSKSEEELIQEELQRQIQAQLGEKDDIFKTLKITLPGSLSSDQIANLPNLALGDKLEQYQIPQLPLPADLNDNTKSANKPSKGPQIKTIVLQQPPTTQTTIKPPTVLFEELTKGVLPPGADFEVIRQKQDGALEEVGKLKDLPQKKVTFVILEEQPDGSVKVQGVRGNENGPTETKGAEVESIIKQIQKGEIKLPPSGGRKNPPPNSTPEESIASPSYVKHSGKSDSQTKRRFTTRSPSYQSTAYSTNSPYQGDKESSVTKSKYQSPTKSTFLPTITPQQEEKLSPVYRGTTEPSFLDHNYSQNVQTKAVNSFSISTPYDHPPTGPAIYDVPTGSSLFSTQSRTTYTQATVDQATPSPAQYSPLPTAYTNLPSSTTLDTATPNPPQLSTASPSGSVLAETLKKSGFFAMAKFLKQSGLESVLNETGPYTLFVPTDRAFRTLLVQLGGPDRAEIKFKENPRLLSGLLLHHVIPGSFKLDTLQDEMTGVSLAGTQLRVNTYHTQDAEWNDVKVTTINGAKILRDKADVVVPQGLAHGVDRVMFPLPVGDILQTLQADREGRFSRFVRLLRETGVASMLTGTKTYTVFAPTDAALADGEVERLLESRSNARALALRHIMPGTLYSAGMLFYQLRDSMSAPNQIQLSKEAGRVKVNNAHVISRNIPTTNGVIHAIDTLL
ncbi:unnamed protein product [Nezara viridula]|uniref:FAS1 domain-containing protein n=1 Tax=Nezara viridula TaxID=85310 RepID=A0A9P0E5P6_NEZVI|nr:unnamed protein product [Nezara viridula]